MAHTPVIGLTTSTLVLPGMRGVARFALAEHYVQCVVEAGGLPLLLPNIGQENAEAYLSQIDGLLLSGGLDVDPMHFGEEPKPDLGEVDQKRDEFELAITRVAHPAGMPIFAICRGIQVLNVAFGGTLFQDVPTEVDKALRHEQSDVRMDALSHSVEIEADTRLRRIVGAARVRVNTFHHQAVKRVAERFRISAQAADGVIEGIEDPDHPFCIGVQWHPERRIADPLSRALFGEFVAAARQAARPADAGAATRT